MNHEQEHGFHMDPRQEAPANPEEQNDPSYQQIPEDDHTHLMTLLGYLEDAFQHGSVMPLTGKRLVDTQMCMEILDDIRGNLPLAIQYSEQVLRDRENILESAERTAANKLKAANVRADAAINDAEKRSQTIMEEAQARAEKIIGDAEIRARAMIDQNAIKIAAQNEGRAIINEARAEANERRLAASAYGESLLINVEKELQRVAEMVRQRRQSMNNEQ
ncbi:MAG: hypothetical protein ACOYI7_00365 [Candidatus Excrementavichristensenella sp.]|jgi:vacuolar-type H+-ATPase subunit H